MSDSKAPRHFTITFAPDTAQLPFSLAAHEVRIDGDRLRFLGPEPVAAGTSPLHRQVLLELKRRAVLSITDETGHEYL